MANREKDPARRGENKLADEVGKLEKGDRAGKRKVVSDWLANLDNNSLDKVIALAGIVDDDDTCERIPGPQLVEPGEADAQDYWRVTWEPNTEN